MTDDLRVRILAAVTNFYLESHDFNGMPMSCLLDELNQPWNSLRDIFKELLKEELLGVIDENTDVNPHVIRRGFEPLHIQLPKLEKDTLTHICIYPRPKYLETIVDKSKYIGEPYRISLALGEPQLAYRSFDLSVLEFYRNEPRYRYENDDIQGHIYYDSDDFEQKDKALLQTFGFSYNDNLDRAVAVFLRYLSDLTPEHQKIWQLKELKGSYKLHPDYYRNTILGEWGERAPICSAFLAELYVINRMSEAMGRPPLFSEDFGEGGERRPRKFGFLIRPTLEEFNNFILLFDKMTSDNINKAFFQNDVPYVTEMERDDGRIQVNPKGTLQILDDWMKKSFKTRDWQPWEEGMSSLRKLRKMRQNPAHSINEDIFDQKYFKQQREIIIEVYKGIRNIRLMFANHRKVTAVKIQVPDWLFEGRIWHI